MTKSITHLLSYLLIIFVCFTTDLHATNWRNGFDINQYLGGDGAKIAIIGSGHNFSNRVGQNYPGNYFLMDNKESPNPDLVHDITQPVPNILNAQFDVVIMEHIPMSIHLDGLSQVYALLKQGGKLITNGICTFRLCNQVEFNGFEGVLIQDSQGNAIVKYETKPGETGYHSIPYDFKMQTTQAHSNNPLAANAINECNNLWKSFVLSAGFSSFARLMNNNAGYLTTLDFGDGVFQAIKP